MRVRYAVTGKTVLRVAAGVALASVLTCGPRQSVRPAMTPAECVVVAPPQTVADTVTVVLGDRVELTVAPWPRNDAERILFHQLYETLVTVDCAGRCRVGVAEDWRRRDGGRRWTFTLRRDARFWDGSRVTAQDFVWSWELAAFDDMPLNAIVDSVSAPDEHTLEVYFNRRYDEVPRALAAPAFAVAKPSPDSPWLLGSAPYGVARAQRGARSIVVAPAFGGRGPVLRFVMTASRDSRDMMASSADFVVTSDATTIDYASSQSDLAVRALPWQHAYVLLAPSRAQAVVRGERTATPSDAFTGALAGDAVRADARGAVDKRWWNDLGDCDGLDDRERPRTPPMATRTNDESHILYLADDPTARDLAERIVALAATSPSHSLDATQLATAVPGIGAKRLVATGVTRGEMERSLRDRDAFAFVVSLPLEPYDACHEARRLLALAPWLPRDAGKLGRAVLALVDTRAHAIVRRERIGVVADVFGDILFVDALSMGPVLP